MFGARSLAWCVLALVLSLPAPSAHSAEFVDAAGRTVEVTDTSRVLAIGGSVTEILYALGLEDRIAAVDTTSVHPPQALATKPNVGYMRALSAEGVLSLNPTLILSVEGAGPPNVIEVLQKAAVPFVSVKDEPTAEGVVNKIRFVADVMGVSDSGRELAAKVEDELQRLSQVVASLERRKRVLFVLSLSGGRPMVAGTETKVQGILELAGALNAIEDFEGFKPASDEALLAGAPDAILMMDHVSAQTPADDVFAIAALAATPAGENKVLISMGGQYLLGFGPRIAHAARDLANRLYPEHNVPDLESGPTGAQ